ncbi:MAG: Rne/Rng family ribonuclease, partial [Proteobacteria bacterium]
MPSEILMNVRPSETRVAYMENGSLVDLKIERKQTPTLVGSVHRGKVMRVLPGMQAAFVDIGLDRAAFLYVGDVRGDMDAESTELFDHATPSAQAREPGDLEEPTEKGDDSAQKPRIQELLTEGQWILVQVAKDPLGTKGARITTHISLPGRNVVFMPTLEHLGVSRRIEDPEERDRLRAIIENIEIKGGVIVRTAGEGATEASLRADIDYLHRLWQEIQRNYDKKTKAGLIHAELDVELRALRDLLSEDVDKVITDDEESFKR